jgi:Tol biopolymer transport system component
MKNKRLPVLTILVLSIVCSCNSLKQTTPSIEITASPSETPRPAPLATASAQPTATLRPSPTPVPIIGAGNLSQVEALHNYWVDVVLAAGLKNDFTTGAVTSVAYSPDGRFVAVAGCQAVAEGMHTGALSCGTLHYTGEPFLVILDAQTGSLVASVPIEGWTWVFRIAFTHDGNTLIYATSDGFVDKLVVWDIPSAKVEIVLEDAAGWGEPVDITVSPDDHWMAIKFIRDGSNGSGNVKIWDLSSGGLDPVTEVPIQALKSLLSVLRLRPKGWGPHFSADSERLLIPADDEFLLYDTTTWQEAGRFKSPCNNRCNLAISPDHSLLVVLEVESEEPDQKPTSVTVWDLKTGGQVRSIGEGLDFPVPLTFTPDGQFLLGINGIGWDVANRWKLINTIQNVQDVAVDVPGIFSRYRTFANDGLHYLQWTSDEITLYGVPASLAQGGTLAGEGEFERPKGKIIVQVWNLDSYESIRYDALTLPEQAAEPYLVRSMDGTIVPYPSPGFQHWALVVVPESGKYFLYLHDQNGGDPVLITESDDIHGVSWSADNRFLAFVTFTSTSELWVYDIQTGQSRKIPLEAYAVRLPSFSPSGERIAFASQYNSPGVQSFHNSSGAAIVNSDGSNEEFIVEAYLSYPRFEWHPDEMRIFYADYEIAGSHARSNIYSVDISEGTRELISDNLGSSSNPRVSPDGNFLAYDERVGGIEVGSFEMIHVIGIGTNHSGTELLVRGRGPVWSQDSRYLAYVSGDQYQYVSVVEIETGKVMQVYEYENLDDSMVLSVEGWMP